jgi:hypothetical protein
VPRGDRHSVLVLHGLFAGDGSGESPETRTCWRSGMNSNWQFRSSNNLTKAGCLVWQQFDEPLFGRLEDRASPSLVELFRNHHRDLSSGSSRTGTGSSNSILSASQSSVFGNPLRDERNPAERGASRLLRYRRLTYCGQSVYRWAGLVGAALAKLAIQNQTFKNQEVLLEGAGDRGAGPGTRRYSWRQLSSTAAAS